MHPTVFEREAPSGSVIRHALETSKQEVLWLAEAPGVRFPTLRGEVQADLLVVGGGYTGLWTAILAKERQPDLRVVLVEGGTLGWAASGRNGGFCEASLTHGHENGASRWPEEMELLDRLGKENLDEIVRTVERHSMQVDLERTGVMQLAVEPHQVAWLEEEPRDDRKVFFDLQAIRHEIASPTYLAGHWDKDANLIVHPAKLVSELARVAAELGVVIAERSPVRRLADDGEHVVAHTDDGRVRAAKTVLGTNVFPSLLLRNRLMTVPVYDYVLATEPLSPAQLESIGWRNRQGLSDTANQFHYYRLTADNRIVYGGYDAVYHAGRQIRRAYEDRPETYRKLASHFLTTFPQLEGIRFTHRWAGVIDTSTRFCAFFGTAHGGKTAYAAGFTGLGVAATRFAGNVMLDLLDGAPTERTELRMVKERPMPFPPEPLAALAINATRWSLDRADHREGKRNLLLRTLDTMGLGFDS